MIFSLVCIVCCNPRSEHHKATDGENRIALKYATGFNVNELQPGIYHVEILRPYKNAQESISYYLVPEGHTFSSPDPDAKIIRTPVERIICTSTTHIPLLDYLDETQALVGFPTPDYISSPAMRSHIRQGNVTDLGIDQSMNTELALSLEPDVIMAYALSGNNAANRKLSELGIPVLINAEYLEEHPLGRAEWIKLAGLLFNKVEMGDSLFQKIESEYLTLASGTDTVSAKPSAFSGILYGDTWFMPGGNNNASRIMQDAGINYLWKDNKETGFLEVSFESVLNRAQNADLWIGVASFKTRTGLLQEDERYGLFDAIRSGDVYSYAGEGDRNPYLELGYLRPDLILSDLINIAHPHLLQDSSMHFYTKLTP